MPTTTYIQDMDYYQPISSVANSSADIGIWGIVAAVLSIVGGILLYFLFVKSKKEPKGKFMQQLKDFLSFKTMWIESLLKIFYYIATIFVILLSFAFISTAFIDFIAVLVLGPIIIRLGYEALIMLVMIWRNTKDIAESTKKK